MPSVRVESDVREQVSLAKSIGWGLEMPEPPYTLEMVEDLRGRIGEQKQFKSECTNQWGLSIPSLPMTQDDVDTFKAAVSQQAVWDKEVETLYSRAQAYNRPKPPYTDREVETYRQATNEADIREQVSLAKSIGWDLEMPESPYTLEMVEDLRGRIAEQKQFKSECTNQWGLKLPVMPMTQDDVDTFKSAVSQQGVWDIEVESLYNQAQAANRPKPPYTDREVETYRQATSATLSRRRNIKLAIGGLTAIVLGFVGLQWNQAQSLESRAKAIGWDVDVPVFGHDGFETQVADSERLKSDVKEIEEKHGITLGLSVFRTAAGWIGKDVKGWYGPFDDRFFDDRFFEDRCREVDESPVLVEGKEDSGGNVYDGLYQ